MAKARKGDDKELPGFVQELVAQAKANRVPGELLEDREVFPKLFTFLGPVEYMHRDETDPKKDKLLVREPVMMVAWDTGTGCWSVTISDKLLKCKVVCVVPRLTGLAEAVEAEMQAGRMRVVPIVKRSR